MLRIAAILFVLALATSFSFGDGKFFGKRLVEARPTIPFQRAVLKFDGREQIMLVESSLSGPEGTYGWVVPLPKKPSYVKAVNPAYIEASFKYVKPRVQTSQGFPFAGLVLAIVYAVVVLTSGLRHRDQGLGTRILYFFLEGGIPLLLCAVLFPVFAQSKESAKKGAAMAEMAKANVESLGTIGSYEVSVLSGETGAPILDWLKEHELVVGNDALPVIEAYAKEGWCFMAAEIRKTESGAYPPHPLKAVFPSDKLIYPMRLTGLQDQPLQLEFLVVSEKEAKVNGMETWACDNSDIKVPIGIDSDQDKEIYADWRSGEYAMAKHGMVWTYLRGEFKPSAMKKDFDVDWKPMERSYVEIWDRTGALFNAVGIFILWGVGGSVLAGLIMSCWTGLTNRGFGVGSLSVVLIAILASAWWYESVKKVETREASIDEIRRPHR
ncbi:MAG: DUF2330 domain-containing protein [Chlorobia bacterium]|nr:DUF2330 domain-containing protein [Fimbriimonadaceae bacterium]